MRDEIVRYCEDCGKYDENGIGWHCEVCGKHLCFRCALRYPENEDLTISINDMCVCKDCYDKEDKERNRL